MNAQNGSWFSKYLSEATFLAFLSFGAYLIAYMHDYGYLGYYNISPDVIRISLESFFLVFIIIYTIILFSFIIINTFIPLIPNNPVLRMKLLRIIYWLALSIFYIICYGPRKDDIIIYIISSIFVSLEIIMPLLLYKDRNGFIDKLIADEEHPKKGLHVEILHKIGPLFYNLILMIMIISSMAYNIGKATAINSKDCYVMTNNQNIAVIKIYQDILVSIPFRPDTKTINGSFIIQKIGENHKVEVIKKNIGPLKFEKYVNELKK